MQVSPEPSSALSKELDSFEFLPMDLISQYETLWLPCIAVLVILARHFDPTLIVQNQLCKLGLHLLIFCPVLLAFLWPICDEECPSYQWGLASTRTGRFKDFGDRYDAIEGVVDDWSMQASLFLSINPPSFLRKRSGYNPAFYVAKLRRMLAEIKATIARYLMLPSSSASSRTTPKPTRPPASSASIVGLIDLIDEGSRSNTRIQRQRHLLSSFDSNQLAANETVKNPHTTTPHALSNALSSIRYITITIPSSSIAPTHRFQRISRSFPVLCTPPKAFFQPQPRPYQAFFPPSIDLVIDSSDESSDSDTIDVTHASFLRQEFPVSDEMGHICSSPKRDEQEVSMESESATSVAPPLPKEAHESLLQSLVCLDSPLDYSSPPSRVEPIQQAAYEESSTDTSVAISHRSEEKCEITITAISDSSVVLLDEQTREKEYTPTITDFNLGSFDRIHSPPSFTEDLKAAFQATLTSSSSELITSNPDRTPIISPSPISRSRSENSHQEKNSHSYPGHPETLKVSKLVEALLSPRPNPTLSHHMQSSASYLTSTPAPASLPTHHISHPLLSTSLNHTDPSPLDLHLATHQGEDEEEDEDPTSLIKKYYKPHELFRGLTYGLRGRGSSSPLPPPSTDDAPVEAPSAMSTSAYPMCTFIPKPADFDEEEVDVDVDGDQDVSDPDSDSDGGNSTITIIAALPSSPQALRKSSSSSSSSHQDRLTTTTTSDSDSEKAASAPHSTIPTPTPSSDSSHQDLASACTAEPSSTPATKSKIDLRPSNDSQNKNKTQMKKNQIPVQKLLQDPPYRYTTACQFVPGPPTSASDTAPVFPHVTSSSTSTSTSAPASVSTSNCVPVSSSSASAYFAPALSANAFSTRTNSNLKLHVTNKHADSALANTRQSQPQHHVTGILSALHDTRTRDLKNGTTCQEKEGTGMGAASGMGALYRHSTGWYTTVAE
ncbi:hypothetical protein SISSUDRAFT_1129347 [Sistotremastrum suecicum HHB10207 ss-3]|uniref:Uncharacterized protein n=1 Tax=Sistotremastrum suecicum HHB10207 ss-3 TaxID=1314776 RepID=A0A166CTR2_9AGAM|nr:hypothetical protein SISSUDRAFT_1129347 [Sistotremastrum suecicum HHB10207 ss-3]